MRKLAWLLVVVGLVLAPGAGAAPPQGLPDEVRLVSGADVKALCEELRDRRTEAAAAVYVMAISSRSFQFQSYDARRARLAVDVARGFRGSTGTWELVLHDLDGGGAARPGDLDLAVPATKQEAAALLKSQRAAELSLLIWFRPAAGDGEAPPCADLRTGDGEGTRLAIEPLAFALMRGETPVASAETPEFAALRDAGEAPVARPDVVVAPAVLTATSEAAPAGVTRAAQAIQPELVACYRKGLEADPALRGLLVLGLTVNDSGAVTDARTEIDGLRAPKVVKCVVGKLKAARFPEGQAERFSVPVKFGPTD